MIRDLIFFSDDGWCNGVYDCGFVVSKLSSHRLVV